MRKFEITLTAAMLASLVMVGCQSGLPTTGDFDTQQTRTARTYRRTGMIDDRPAAIAAASAWATLIRRRDPAVMASLYPSPTPTPVPTALPTLIATPTAIATIAPLPTSIATISPILLDPILVPIATPTPTPTPTAIATFTPILLLDPILVPIATPTPTPTPVPTVDPCSPSFSVIMVPIEPVPIATSACL